LIAVRRINAVVNTSMRCGVVAIAICSWFAISNHCAFGAVATKSEPSESECPFHSKPAKPQTPPPGIQCYRILRAVVSAVAKSWARDDTKFSDVDPRLEKFSLIAVSFKTATALLHDTGPPDARTFAELILQRSLLAHAPPLLA
jgi:hypothetical protein